MGSWGRLLVALAIVLTGCLKPELVACGDKLCAKGAVCLPDGTCASQDAIAACMGMPDGEACTINTFTGSCRSGVCVAPVCGDGVVSGAEQCDGSISDIDCVDFGFDLGLPTCNTRCDFDFLAGCTRFGWRRVHAGSVRHAAADSGRLAWISSMDELHIDGTPPVDDPGPWRDITSNRAGTFVALSLSEIALFNGSTRTSLGLPPHADVRQAEVDADGTAYAMVSDGCRVYSKAPTAAWTLIRAQSTGETCNEISIDRVDHSLLLAVHTASDAGRIERWNGTSWSTIASPTQEVLAVAGHGGTVWAGLSFGGLLRISGGSPTAFMGNDYISEVRDVGGYVFINGNGPTRLDGDMVEQLSQPTDGTLLSDGSRLYAAGSGIYEYSGTSFASRVGRTLDVYTITLATNGDPVIGSDLSISGPASYDRYTWAGDPVGLAPVAIAAASRTDVYATDHNSLVHFTGASTQDVTPPGFAGINGLALAGTTLYAVGDNGLAMVKSGGWSTLSPGGAAGCDFHAVVAAAGSVFACGACGSVGSLWQLAGTTWTELHRGGGVLDALALTSDGDVIAAGSTGGGWWRNGAWVDAPQAIGVSVSATSSDDVWVAGGPDDVIHYDGMVWSRLKVEGTSKPRVAATPHAVYFAGVQLSTLLR